GGRHALSLLRRLIHVPEARDGESEEAVAIPLVLRAALERDDGVDELEARSELLLHLAEGLVKTEELGVRHVGEALVLAGLGDPELLAGELLHGGDERLLVRKLLFDQGEGA